MLKSVGSRKKLVGLAPLVFILASCSPGIHGAGEGAFGVGVGPFATVEGGTVPEVGEFSITEIDVKTTSEGYFLIESSQSVVKSSEENICGDYELHAVLMNSPDADPTDHESFPKHAWLVSHGGLEAKTVNLGTCEEETIYNQTLLDDRGQPKPGVGISTVEYGGDHLKIVQLPTIALQAEPYLSHAESAFLCIFLMNASSEYGFKEIVNEFIEAPEEHPDFFASGCLEIVPELGHDGSTVETYHMEKSADADSKDSSTFVGTGESGEKTSDSDSSFSGSGLTAVTNEGTPDGAGGAKGGGLKTLKGSGSGSLGGSF